MIQPHEASWQQLSPTLAYRLAALRSIVFVVEQNCPYLDLDGRDLETTTRQCWIEGPDGAPVSALRLLAEPGGGWRIGRVVTAASHRGQGLAAILVGHALSRPGPFVLDAQAHLGDWYGAFGFRRSGADFLLDGIPHTPMRRP